MALGAAAVGAIAVGASAFLLIGPPTRVVVAVRSTIEYYSLKTSN